MDKVNPQHLTENFFTGRRLYAELLRSEDPKTSGNQTVTVMLKTVKRPKLYIILSDLECGYLHRLLSVGQTFVRPNPKTPDKVYR